VERVIGWFKEYRRLDTRHKKLGINYVAMWLVAIIDKTLFRLLPNKAWPPVHPEGATSG
jgi:hypothetical protein